MWSGINIPGLQIEMIDIREPSGGVNYKIRIEILSGNTQAWPDAFRRRERCVRRPVRGRRLRCGPARENVTVRLNVLQAGLLVSPGNSPVIAPGTQVPVLNSSTIVKL